jgi:spermidine synthase
MGGVLAVKAAVVAMTVWVWVMTTIKPIVTVNSSRLSAKGHLAQHRVALAPFILIFCSGMNLILVQWVLVRELTALLFGTELVVLLVSTAYFLGISLGYALSKRIRLKNLGSLAIFTLILHLSLPIWFRLMVAGLDLLGAYPVAFILLPLLTPFWVSAFYSIFLPLLIDNQSGSLTELYSLELIGSLCGIGILIFLGGLGLQTVYIVYSLGLLAILTALKINRGVLGLMTIGAGMWLMVLPELNLWSNTLWYMQLRELPEGTKTVFSGYSAYQKVDVLETPYGKRFLYLDGLEHFGSYSGERLNVVMGQIPAALMHPENALVIGAGSMQMEALIAEHAGYVTTVELDPMVVEVGQRYFASYNHMDTLTNHHVVIDDAKHFVANTEAQYDLVATDVPAAFSIQTATLYSESFYQSIEEHMLPQGVLVVGLTSTFAPDDTVSRRIAASLLAVFDEVVVITAPSAGWSFAYASNDMPFDLGAIEAALQARYETGYVIFDTLSVKEVVGEADPITLDSMGIVLEVSFERIKDRFE